MLAVEWVVLLVVVGVNGAGYVRVRGCGRACWPSSGSFWWSLVDDFCVFTGVAAPSGRRLGRLGRLGCLLVDDFCGAGVGLSSVQGCGRGWWPSCGSFRCLREARLALCEAAPRWCEAAPRWCEAVGEAVGCWCDAKRCVIVTQHVVGWGGKHPNTRENTLTHEGVEEARYTMNPHHP